MSRRRPKKQPTLPPRVLKPGTQIRRRRPIRSGVLVAAGVVVALLAGLAILGSVGGSDDGGEATEKAADSRKRPPVTTSSETPAVSPGQTTTAQASSAVSVELQATEAVWVCLVDDQGRMLVNSETLSTGDQRGPFGGEGFEMTFGNGSVELTVDGQPTEVPAVAEPIGYRVLPGKVRRLEPSAQPSCT